MPEPARGDDRFVEIDAGVGEFRLDARTRCEATVLDDAAVGHVEGPRHVARTQSRTRLWRLAGEAFRRASVDDLHAVVRDRHAHVVKQSDRADIHLGGELSWRPLDRAFLQRPAFQFPLRQPTVEDVDLLRAEKSKRPPYARGRV